MTEARSSTVAVRGIAATVVGVLLALPFLLAVPAQASTYRYWTYWWGSGSGKQGTGWTFANVGPAAHRVNDTWVLGWRFATTSTVGGAKPRQSPTFSDLCPSMPDPVAGKDRVALVIDYGTLNDAPPGQRPPMSGSVQVECRMLDSAPHQTGVAVLNQAGIAVRQNDNGLLCALDGYPVGECAPVIADPVPVPTPSRTPSHAVTPTPSPAASRTSSTPVGAQATLPRSGGSSPPVARTSATTTATPPTAPAAAAVTDEPTLPAVSGTPAASAAEEGSSGPTGAVAGLLVVTLLGASAWWTTRRRST